MFEHKMPAIVSDDCSRLKVFGFEGIVETVLRWVENREGKNRSMRSIKIKRNRTVTSYTRCVQLRLLFHISMVKRRFRKILSFVTFGNWSISLILGLDSSRRTLRGAVILGIGISVRNSRRRIHIVQASLVQWLHLLNKTTFSGWNSGAFSPRIAIMSSRRRH